MSDLTATLGHPRRTERSLEPDYYTRAAAAKSNMYVNQWHEARYFYEAAFYFSGITYTTIGYGDLVLAKPWRLLGPVEGLVGILMCGLSTGYFFVVVSRTLQSRHVEATVSTTERTRP